MKKNSDGAICGEEEACGWGTGNRGLWEMYTSKEKGRRANEGQAQEKILSNLYRDELEETF